MRGKEKLTAGQRAAGGTTRSRGSQGSAAAGRGAAVLQQSMPNTPSGQSRAEAAKKMAIARALAAQEALAKQKATQPAASTKRQQAVAEQKARQEAASKAAAQRRTARSSIGKGISPKARVASPAQAAAKASKLLSPAPAPAGRRRASAAPEPSVVQDVDEIRDAAPEDYSSEDVEADEPSVGQASKRGGLISLFPGFGKAPKKRGGRGVTRPRRNTLQLGELEGTGPGSSKIMTLRGKDVQNWMNDVGHVSDSDGDYLSDMENDGIIDIKPSTALRRTTTNKALRPGIVLADPVAASAALNRHETRSTDSSGSSNIDVSMDAAASDITARAMLQLPVSKKDQKRAGKAGDDGGERVRAAVAAAVAELAETHAAEMAALRVQLRADIEAETEAGIDRAVQLAEKRAGERAKVQIAAETKRLQSEVDAQVASCLKDSEARLKDDFDKRVEREKKLADRKLQVLQRRLGAAVMNEQEAETDGRTSEHVKELEEALAESQHDVEVVETRLSEVQSELSLTVARAEVLENRLREALEGVNSPRSEGEEGSGGSIPMLSPRSPVGSVERSVEKKGFWRRKSSISMGL